MAPQTLDVLLKILPAVLGAVVGVLAKTVVDVYIVRSRMHSLLPLILEQVEETASICSQAFAVDEAKAAEPLCETAFQGLSELISLGAKPRAMWSTGAKLLLTTLVQIRKTASSGGARAISALDALRERGTDLEKWLKAAEQKVKRARA
jgi:hypothetical protein